MSFSHPLVLDGVLVSPANSKEQKRLKLGQNILEHTKYCEGWAEPTGPHGQSPAKSLAWMGRSPGQEKEGSLCSPGVCWLQPRSHKPPRCPPSQRKAMPAPLYQREALVWLSLLFKVRAKARRPGFISGTCCREHGLDWQEVSTARKTSGGCLGAF